MNTATAVLTSCAPSTGSTSLLLMVRCGSLVRRGSALRGGLVLCATAALLVGGCASSAGGVVATAAPQEAAAGVRRSSAAVGVTRSGAAAASLAQLLARGQDALDRRQPQRAVESYTQALDVATTQAEREQVLLALATAHESARDCERAVVLWDQALDVLSADARGLAQMRQGACLQELERWPAAQRAYAQARRDGVPTGADALEAVARQIYSAFMADASREDIEALAAEAEQVIARVDERERLTTRYFVGMVRFYGAAVVHRDFRALVLRAEPELMAQDYARKLDLLVEAQRRYNDTIRARHMHWVSAAGYQLGTMIAEFYDALLLAPVPEYLDERGRRVYFAALHAQLVPVVEKAIWVLGRTVSTAATLGYHSDFVELARTRLQALQAVAAANDADAWSTRGATVAADVRRAASSGHGHDPAGVDGDYAEQRLFVAQPTPL